MSKGNSGLLSKFQTKQSYTTTGIIGSLEGFEVFTEVVLRFRSSGVQGNHNVTVEAKMSTDDEWETIFTLLGPGSDIVHIANWDFIRFRCNVLNLDNGPASLVASAFFQDGLFTVNAINKMSEGLNDKILLLTCKLEDVLQELKINNRQLEFLTDEVIDEEDEE